MEARERARLQLAADARYDPLLFAEKAWPWGKKGTPLADKDIRAWQAEVFDEIAQHLLNPETRFTPLRIAVGSGHGIGKSAGMGMLSSWALSCFRNPRVVVTANTEGQLRTKTSPEIGQWVKTSMFGDKFEVDTFSIKLKGSPDQHRLDLTPWSEANPEAFAGLHAEGRIVLVMMDEASGIPSVIWETIEGAMTDENTVLIQIAFGNPTSNRGPFRECFRKHKKHWKTWQIDSRDVEGTNKVALQSIIDRYGEHSDIAKVRVKGQFPSASSRQFIPTHYVDPAFGRHLRPEQYEFAPKIIAMDPAWTGEDELVIVMRQGLYSVVLDVMPKNDNDMYVASRLAHFETRHGADAVFIDAGYGTGIYSAGITMGRDWRLVWFGEAAVDKGCLNKRAEMWRDMRNWLASGGAIPKDQELYEHLITPETKPRPDGVIQLESKEDIKKRKLPSPDRADALAITFAYPVEKKQQGGTNYAAPTHLPPRTRVEVFEPYEGN